MPRRLGAVRSAPPRQTASPPPAIPNMVSVGHNKDIQHVVMIFGDPTAEPPQFITFTPEQARGLGRGLIAEADKAEGISSVPFVGHKHNASKP